MERGTLPYMPCLYYGTKQLYFGCVNLKSQPHPNLEDILQKKGSRRRGLKKTCPFLKEVRHPSLKMCIFCALSQNYQHLFESRYTSYSKLSKKLKNDIKIK